MSDWGVDECVVDVVCGELEFWRGGRRRRVERFRIGARRRRESCGVGG